MALEEEVRAVSLGRDEAPSGQPLLGMIDLQSWKEALGKPSTIAKREVGLSHFTLGLLGDGHG